MKTPVADNRNNRDIDMTVSLLWVVDDRNK